MTDDRFTDGNPYRDQKSQHQDWKTLEEAVKEAIQRGQEKEMAMLMNLLPDEIKVKYRRIWMEMKGKK